MGSKKQPSDDAARKAREAEAARLAAEQAEKEADDKRKRQSAERRRLTLARGFRGVSGDDDGLLSKGRKLSPGRATL